MRKRDAGFHVAVAAAAIVFAAACGKNGGSGSPVAPSGSQPQAAPAALTGATIAGAVISGAGSPRSINARTASVGGGGITVSILGTSISTTVDSAGHFTLQNVPQGDVTLMFAANGVTASVTVTGVMSADQVRITVTLNGSAAQIDEHQHEGADHQTELEGRVTATACGANPPTITIGVAMPMTVDVRTARIRHGGTALTCAQIQVDDRVEAHGSVSGTMLIATDVNVETEHPQQPGDGNDDGEDDHNNRGPGHDQEAEVEGTVSGAPAGHACPAFSFSVGAMAVTTSAATKFEGVSCAAMTNGIRVEVKGTRTAANAIAATKVEKK
jgi:hypothetical protein